MIVGLSDTYMLEIMINILTEKIVTMIYDNDTTINKSLVIFEKIATTENAWYIRLAGYNALELLKDLYQTKKKEAQDKIKQLQLKNEKNLNIATYQKEMENAELQHARISSLIRKIKSMESDKKLVDIYSKDSGG